MPPRVILGTPDQRKAQRVNLLNSLDWMTTRHRDQLAAGATPTLSPDQYLQLLDYKQALRDWPVSGDYNEAFPIPPGWL